MPEYIELSRLNKNLYREGCPVVIENGALFSDENKTVVFAMLNIRNISTKVIDSLLVDFHIFDRANKEIEVIRDYQYDPHVQRGETFGSDIEVKIIGTAGATFSVAVKRVIFDDETAWEGSSSIMFETLPLMRKLEEELSEEELLGQYKRDFKEKLSKNEEADPKYIPTEYKDVWVCSCGCVNHKDEETCFACKTAYSTQTDYLYNKALIADNLKEHLRLEAEKAEKARIAAEEKAAAEAAAKAEAERLAELERQRIENERKRKIAIRNTIIAVSIPAAIAFIIYLVILFTYIMPKSKYDTATELLNAGEFDSAIALYDDIPAFSDSQDMIKLAKYRKALSLMREDKYTAALAVFGEIPDYKDSALKINQCNYGIAYAYYDQGDFERSAEMFAALGDYFDSADRCSASYLGIATEYVKSGDYDTAVSYLDKLTESHKEELYNAFYEKGATLYGEGKSDEAEVCFSYVKSEASKDKVNEIYYQAAMDLITREKFDEAVTVLETIPDYKDVADQFKRIDYLRATKLFDSGSYEEATALYTSLGEYEDAADMVKECNYRIALEAYKNGEYELASTLFSDLADYSDSKDYYYKATYNYGLALYNSGKTLDSYKVLYSIKEYDPAYYDLRTKSYYYRDVYDKGLGVKP